MSSINKAILIGRLGKDPEIKYTADRVAIARFSLATSETYKDKDGNKIENTEWHNIVAWRTLAETAEKFLKKGKQIYVEGKIKTRSWDDKDGNKKYITEIIADNFVMLGKKEDDTTSENKANTEEVLPEVPVTEEVDDLPF